jgi:hypothetical protein
MLIKIIFFIRAETKALARISGVCWDFDNCDGTQLKGCMTIVSIQFASRIVIMDLNFRCCQQNQHQNQIVLLQGW